MSGEELLDDAVGYASAEEAVEGQEGYEPAEGSPEGSPDPSDVEDLLEDSSGSTLTSPRLVAAVLGEVLA